MAAGNQYDLVITIGPLIMMKFVVKTCQKHAEEHRLHEPHYDRRHRHVRRCRLTVGGETKFACVDGPDFDGDLVDLMRQWPAAPCTAPFEAHAREAACNLLNQEVK